MENNITNKFINPYTFIPLEKEKAIYKSDDTNLLKGRMTIELKTRTPLFIPDTSNDSAFSIEGEEKGHKSYDFFQYGGQPVIPGSEIRGMIRSAYETLTSSCMSAIDDDVEIVKRISDAFLPGFIKRNGNKFLLIEAEKNKVFKDAAIGSFVEDGYYMRGEAFRKDKAKSVFKIPENEMKICVLDEIHKKMLDLVLDSYQNEKTNKKLGRGHSGYAEYTIKWNEFKSGKGAEYFPVYYSKIDDDLIYLSPACITKEAYQTKLSDILTSHGNFGACKDKNKCPACELFGMVSKEHSKGSLLRFTDAKLTENKSESDIFWTTPVTLEELAQPKIAASEFYLKRPAGARFWTYDYYVDKNGIHPYTPELAGRKYYWHHKDVKFIRSLQVTKNTPKEIIKDIRNKRNKTIRPLKEGVVFCADIYFDGITQKQLNQIYAICNISNEFGDGINGAGYKLGTGKPLGLGSVTIKVKECVIREVSLTDDGIAYEENRVDMQAKMCDETVGFVTNSVEAFIRVAKFDSIGEYKVTYPVTDKQLDAVIVGKKHGEGFKWFQKNHSSGTVKKRNASYYVEPLPHVLSDDITLSAFKEIVNDNKHGNQNINNYNKSDYKCKTPGCGNKVSINSISGKPFAYCRECFNKNKTNYKKRGGNV